MLDTRKTVVTALKTVLNNTKYELDVKSPTLPLITYKAIDDAVYAYGNKLGYSDVKYQVKLWTNKVSDLATYTVLIDKALKQIGLKRTYFNELKENEVIIGVLQYSGLVKEEFTTED